MVLGLGGWWLFPHLLAGDLPTLRPRTSFRAAGG